MDENFEKDALRLLDKNVKREIKKVRSALIPVPVQIVANKCITSTGSIFAVGIFTKLLYIIPRWAKMTLIS